MPPSPVAWAACSAVILAGCCLGQTPLSAGNVSVSGSVISAAGEPLRRVALRLAPLPSFGGSSLEVPAANAAAETDLQGNFHFEEVPPGRYMLSAERTGYLNAYYSNARGSVLTVKPDQPTAGILIKMAPQGIVAGRVVDEERESLPGVAITVRSYPVPGQLPRVELPGGSGKTDADGAFAIGGLLPGRYVVSVAPPPSLASPAKSLSVPTLQESYVTTYYPDATVVADATPVEIGADSQVRGLEIRLQRVPVFNLRGKVVDAATGEVGSAANVSLIRLGGGPPGLSARSTGLRAGEFSFDGVLPGAYLLETKPVAGVPGHPPLVGCQIVSVGNADLAGVVVEVKPAIELSGRVLIEGAPASSWPQITLTPTDVLNYPESPMVDAEGRFTLTGLEPAHYRVTVGSAPPPLFVKSIRFNGLDLAGEIDFASAPGASLEIVMAYGTSSISGVVSDFDGPVGPGVTVMATRKNPPYRIAQTDETGRFLFTGLAPGDYFLVARDIGPATMPPDFVEKLGKVVTVGEGDQAAADLRLTANDDLRAVDSR